MTNNPQLMQDAAEYWGGKGFPVFPLKPRLKVPDTKDGFKSATTDLATIKEWFADNPNRNLGLSTGGGLVVIDVDTKDGDGMAELVGLENRLGKLPDTMTVATPSGGKHFYFSYPPELDIRSSAKQLSPNIDVRANGGYVVVPPSKTEANADPKGKTCTGAYVLDARLPRADLPSEWLEELQPKRDHKPHNPPPRYAEPSHGQRLTEIKHALTYIDATPHDQWIRVGMGLHSLGNDGLALWDAWSSKAPNYDAKEIPIRWKSFAGKNVNPETVFFLATANGWQNPRAGYRTVKRGASQNRHHTTKTAIGQGISTVKRVAAIVMIQVSTIT